MDCPPASSQASAHLQSTHLFFSEHSTRDRGHFINSALTWLLISSLRLCVSVFQKPKFLRFMVGWPIYPAKCHLHQQVWTFGWASTWTWMWTVTPEHANRTLQTQKLRMVWAVKDLKDHPVSFPLPWNTSHQRSTWPIPPTQSKDELTAAIIFWCHRIFPF